MSGKRLTRSAGALLALTGAAALLTGGIAAALAAFTARTTACAIASAIARWSSLPRRLRSIFGAGGRGDGNLDVAPL